MSNHSITRELGTLYHILFSRVKGATHAERLESFYAGQAGGYDDFRKRLLHGREEMIRRLDFRPGDVWVDMGGGTGSNIEALGEKVRELGKVYIVDLTPSLLTVARRRIADRNWKNVEAVAGDATCFEPVEGLVDVVTFSYSLTMIPDWFSAIEQAFRILKPGGLIGVTDFQVSRKHPVEGNVRHGWLTRTFWPAWFASDNVFLSPDHLPFLQRHFDCRFLAQKRGRPPYLPFVTVPYYTFIGSRSLE